MSDKALSFTRSHPLINSMWVTLPCLVDSHYVSLTTTNRLWVTLHCLLSGCLSTSHTMTNSGWIIILSFTRLFQCILYYKTACEWHCSLCPDRPNTSHSMTNSKWVMLWHMLFTGSLRISYGMSNSMWATLHILQLAAHLIPYWQYVSDTVHLWQTVPASDATT